MVGDWVIVRRYSGLALEKDGIPCKLANDDDILAVIASPKGWKAYIAT
jgi:co-chaperonin GroES (HSP10)